jgi:hypothetical protein
MSIGAVAVELFWRVGEGTLIAHERSPSPSAEPDSGNINLRLTSLRSLLRRCPFWLRGHQRLGELSLSIDDVATAYAAAQCLLAGTTEHTSLRGEAYLLLGRSFLRRGDWRTSVNYLDRASVLLPNDQRVSEECAAAYMAGGDRQRALQILEAIPSKRISSAANAALQFLRSPEASSGPDA